MPTINETPNDSLLPNRPFDGQKFIDRNGVEWIFNEETECWRSNGRQPDIPLANEKTTGLLDKKLKKILNSVDDKGGHFGIIVKPLLTNKPFGVKPLFVDRILRHAKTESGSTIWGEKPFTQDDKGDYNTYVKGKMAGLVIIFKTGKLKDKQFRILDNDNGRIYVEGDITSAKYKDTFEIYDPIELNPHGILSGNVELVSDSLDISCVTGDGLEDDCEQKSQDNVPPKGLSINVKKEFLDSICFELPGCAGPRGDKGDKGEKGKDGTGDGPRGDQGDSGQDATTQGVFSGIKYVDLDDIYDTAVVAIEPDPDAGKLYIVKSKVRTPSGDGQDIPADQVIATAINRSVIFEEEFFFRLSKPEDGTDPIKVDSKKGVALAGSDGASCAVRSNFNNDVLIAALPKGGVDADGNSELTLVWLSDILTQLGDFYRDKLQAAAEKYDRDLKNFIFEKDEEARNVICNLAQELAECEWELPLEFCLGLTQGDCAPDTQETTDFPFAAALFGDEKYNLESDPKAQVVSRPFVLGGELSHWPEAPVVVRTDGTNATGREVDVDGSIIEDDATDELSSGDYLLVWDGGTMFDYEFVQLGHWVGPVEQAQRYGVKVRIVYPDGSEDIKPFPVPQVLQNVKPAAQRNPNVAMGAWCIPLGAGGQAQYFCALTPQATGDPNLQYQWIEGAFAGFWNPGEVFPNGRQVPKPGTSAYQSGQPIPSGKHNSFDMGEVIDAYRSANLMNKSVTWSFNSDGGKVFLQCPLLGSGTPPQFANRQQSLDECLNSSNIIKFKLYRITS